jgi:iron(III) transport system substrate-binding protein
MRAAAARVCLAALLAFGGCADDGRTPLVVYSPHGEDILREFERMFEEANPDVDVRWFNMATQECLTRLRGERENASCDVWWGAPFSTFARAAAEGLLEPYEPSYAAALDAGSRDPEFRYSGQFTMPQVIVYNRERLTADEAPKSWDDLVSPQWEDRLVMRFPLPSGSLRGAFSWFVAWKASGDDDAAAIDAGFDWLAKLHRATRRYLANPTELFEAITKDEAKVATVWNLADAIFQSQRHGYPFAFAIPKEGVPIVIDGIALVAKTGSDPADDARAAAARAFYEFVNTLDSLAYLAKGHGRIPLRQDFPAERRPPWLRDLEFRPLPVDPALPAREEDAWMQRWDETIKPLPRD